MGAPYTQSATVTVTSSLTDVLIMQANGLMHDATVTINNTGSNATTGLAILRQHDANGPWLPWLSGTDFATATSRYNPSINPAPNAVPAAGTGWVDLKPGAVTGIKVQVASTSGTTVTVTLAGRNN